MQAKLSLPRAVSPEHRHKSSAQKDVTFMNLSVTAMHRAFSASPNCNSVVVLRSRTYSALEAPVGKGGFCGGAGQVRVEQARICYGGVAPKCIMATNAQAALEGQPWSQATLDAALLAVAKDVNITPDAPGLAAAATIAAAATVPTAATAAAVLTLLLLQSPNLSCAVL